MLEATKNNSQELRETSQVRSVAEQFLAAWNSHDVSVVLSTYTADLVYRDPNTRGEIHGQNALGRYLKKLFDRWHMIWTLREMYPLATPEGDAGTAVLWRSEINLRQGSPTIEIFGMDLVKLRDHKVARNEVYFDRALLTPLLEKLHDN